MKPILICIAGGSASGKTTVVDEIRSKIGKEDAIFIAIKIIYQKKKEEKLIMIILHLLKMIY